MYPSKVTILNFFIYLQMRNTKDNRSVQKTQFSLRHASRLSVMCAFISDHKNTLDMKGLITVGISKHVRNIIYHTNFIHVYQQFLPSPQLTGN